MVVDINLGYLGSQQVLNFFQKNYVVAKKILVISALKFAYLIIAYILLGYQRDSNAAAHSVDTGISQAEGLKRIENDIECPIYMLESTRIITISLQKELVGTLFRK